MNRPAFRASMCIGAGGYALYFLPCAPISCAKPEEVAAVLNGDGHHRLLVKMSIVN